MKVLVHGEDIQNTGLIHCKPILNRASTRKDWQIILILAKNIEILHDIYLGHFT